MDTNTTITANILTAEPVEFIVSDDPALTIPVVVGWNPDGSMITARDLAARPRLEPEQCNHAGATWSANLELRCPRCRQPLFLPPPLLAYLPASTITAMDILWSAAGWPEWGTEDWWFLPEHWTLTAHPLFAHCGGIPVRHDHLQQFQDALAELHL
jgi:hypothetical protein